MDEIGMVVTGIEDDGALTVDRSGGLYPCKLGEGPVDIVGDGDVVPGVLSMGSMHRPDAATRHITWADVRILTGLSPAQLKAAGVRIGSSAVPARSRRGPVLFGDESDPLVAAWTFDDRMGVVTLLRLLELMKVEDFALARATLICFTVHEEGGCHGAKALPQRERPEVFIAVDGWQYETIRFGTSPVFNPIATGGFSKMGTCNISFSAASCPSPRRFINSPRIVFLCASLLSHPKT